MLNAMLLAKKKNKVIVDPGNILFLSHFDDEVPYNLVDGVPLIKTGTGTHTQSDIVKFGERAVLAEWFTAGDYQFPLRERLSPNAWTIEGWFYHGSEGGSGQGRGANAFRLGHNPLNGGYGLSIEFSNAYMARISVRSSATFSGNEQYFNTQTSPLGKNFDRKWEHFALVKDGTFLRAYFGGDLVLSQSGANQPDDSALRCRLGFTGTFDSSCFDEWRITNNQVLYSENFTPVGPFTELDVQ
jgi:hypothetical protein